MKLSTVSKMTVRLGTHWWMLALTVALFVLVAVLVDLKPVVDENFFFSTSDPQFRPSKKIEQRFPSRPEVILTVSSRNISAPRYLGRIQKLTQQINTIDAVSAVKSLTAGPKNFADALASPFWSRLLIAPDRRSSNVIVFMEGKDTEKSIKHLERIMHELDEKDFRIHIAGLPYVVEMIRRSLAHDFWYFSLTAVVLFGLTMAVNVPIRSGVSGNARDLHERRFVDVAPPVNVRQKDRHPHGEPRHDRVCRGVVAFGLHDLQLADTCRPDGKEIARSRGSRPAHDISRFVLVNGLRVARVRQFVDRPSQAVARTGIQRRARDGRGIDLRLRDVSVVPALGCAAQK